MADDLYATFDPVKYTLAQTRLRDAPADLTTDDLGQLAAVSSALVDQARDARDAAQRAKAAAAAVATAAPASKYALMAEAVIETIQLAVEPLRATIDQVTVRATDQDARLRALEDRLVELEARDAVRS
jgi:hypothetical protein